MATYQIDTEKQTLLAGSGHNYAWTNCYLIDAPSLDVAWDWAVQIAEHEALALPVVTSVRFIQARAGIGGPAPMTPRILGLAGALPYVPTSIPLFNAARLVAYADPHRLVWYKRWRGPLRPEDYTGELLSSAYIATLTTLLDWLLGYVPHVTRSGERVTAWQVDPRVHQWQMRDGTRRRIDSVIAP